MGMWIRANFAVVCCLQAVLLVGCHSPADRGRSAQRELIQGLAVEAEDAEGDWDLPAGLIPAEAEAETVVPGAADVAINNDVGWAVDLPADAACPFRPTALRIHPLTRLQRVGDSDSGMPTIEVRLELTDQFGDTTKGLGFLQLDLYERGNGSNGGRGWSGLGRHLFEWEPEFTAVAANARQFDRVTRTYIFLLELAAGVEFPQHCVLQATLITHDRELVDRFEVVFP